MAACHGQRPSGRPTQGMRMGILPGSPIPLRNQTRQTSAISHPGKPHRNTIQPSHKACKQSERFSPSHWAAKAFRPGGIRLSDPRGQDFMGTRIPIKGMRNGGMITAVQARKASGLLPSAGMATQGAWGSSGKHRRIGSHAGQSSASALPDPWKIGHDRQIPVSLNAQDLSPASPNRSITLQRRLSSEPPLATVLPAYIGEPSLIMYGPSPPDQRCMVT